MISVLIVTYNEEKNIESCISSVSWSDDILIVDSNSNDRTEALAVSMGARVIKRPFDNFANQRNFGLDEGNLKYPWVLHLDADEHVSPDLRNEIKNIINSEFAKDGYMVPSKLMFLGKWLKYSGMYPCYQARFGRSDKLRFKMVGHGQREIINEENMGICKGALIHFNFSKGITEWLIKHAKYAKDEAEERERNKDKVQWMGVFNAASPVQRRRFLKLVSDKLPCRPLLRFLYIYIIKLGFLDGSGGFRYAMLISSYQWFIDLNIKEISSEKK